MSTYKMLVVGMVLEAVLLAALITNSVMTYKAAKVIEACQCSTDK